ncbi:RNA polymerase sigma factor (sigma-70 family) [Paenibacillus sp. DS2015]|uniref:sigma factor n=1 Tax=Paenibacillus sp. DS2015 TaxID=3373917 RepID=UPI003D237C6B
MGVLKLREHNPHLGDREEIIRQGLKSVRKIAQRYKSLCYAKGIDIEDMVSEGTIGLLLAYDRFDPGEREVHFNAFSFPYIKGHMLQFVQKKAAIIRFPQLPGQLVQKIVSENLESQTPEVVSKRLNLSLEKATDALQNSKLAIVGSLNQTVRLGTGEEGSELINFVPTHDDDTVLQVEQFINTLDSFEKRVVRFLLDGFKIYEVARRMSVSKDKLNSRLDGLQKKASSYFYHVSGSEGMDMRRANVTKNKYMELRAQDLSDAKVAEQLGVGIKVLYKFKREWGLVKSRPEKVNITMNQYKNLREQGFIDSKIAERFGIGDSALYKRKKEWGLIESRPQKQTNNQILTEAHMNKQEYNSSSDVQSVLMSERISNLESENKLLWDMVTLLKRKA